MWCAVLRVACGPCEERPDVLVINAGQDRNIGLVSLRLCFVQFLIVFVNKTVNGKL